MTRILYSFPHRIGAGRICHTAWQQVAGLAAAGARVTVLAGSVARALPPEVDVRTTLSHGRFRLPVRLLGRRRACAWHDAMTARWLERHHEQMDAVHGWPLASRRTLEVARRHGVRTFLERPNAHTALAYEVVRRENARIGITLADDHDHAFNAVNLAHEEREYALADYLLCPSRFVEESFRQRGFSARKLVRHRYGYDSARFRPGQRDQGESQGLTVLYAGVCEPRKGLHVALEAWLASGAQERGRFVVCGAFVSGYAERLGALLNHPSVQVLGHRDDLPELMREADVFVLSSFEEGSALVTYEARGSGCVPLVSSATGAVCTHGVDALVHEPGDVATLGAHFSRVDRDRALLATLRARSVAGAHELTWEAAGRLLADLYRDPSPRESIRSTVTLAA